MITFPPGGAKSIVTWYHGRGGMEFTALTNTLAYASRLKAKGGATAYAGACGQIRSAALAAQAAPAMPLPSGAKPYSEALAGYVKTATACEQASSTRGTTEIRESVAQVEANSVALNRAAAVLIAALSET